MQQAISVLVSGLVLAGSALARPPYAPGKDPAERAGAQIPAKRQADTAPGAGTAAPVRQPAPAARPTASSAPRTPGVVPGQRIPDTPKAHDLYEQALEGDSLFAISRRRQVPLRALIEANALEPPFTLAAGQYLRLPPPRIHVVESDETLFSVSRRFNVDLRSLALINRLEKPWMVAPGDRLMLPVLARDNLEAAMRGGTATGVAAGTTQLAGSSSGPRPLVSGAPATGAPPTEPQGVQAGIASAASPPAGTVPIAATLSGPIAFRWPARGKLVRAFGPQPGGQRLDGLQMALPNAAVVSAAAAGIVVYRGEDLPGFGKLMLLKHEGGWVTAYAHLGRFLADEGARVQPGQTIAEAGRAPATPLVPAKGVGESPGGGTIGHTGPASLHFEIRNPRGRPVDPQNVIGRL